MKKIAFNLSSFSEKQVGLKVHIINLIKNFSFSENNKVYIYVSKDSLKLLDVNIINKTTFYNLLMLLKMLY